MITDKKTLMAIKNYLKNRSGWSLEELISTVTSETNMLKHQDMGENTLSIDECGIEWDGDSVCLLEDFVNRYTELFIDRMCNVIDSFIDEDISWFEESE